MKKISLVFGMLFYSLFQTIQISALVDYCRQPLKNPFDEEIATLAKEQENIFQQLDKLTDGKHNPTSPSTEKVIALTKSCRDLKQEIEQTVEKNDLLYTPEQRLESLSRCRKAAVYDLEEFLAYMPEKCQRCDEARQKEMNAEATNSQELSTLRFQSTEHCHDYRESQKFCIKLAKIVVVIDEEREKIQKSLCK